MKLFLYKKNFNIGGVMKDVYASQYHFETNIKMCKTFQKK